MTLHQTSMLAAVIALAEAARTRERLRDGAGAAMAASVAGAAEEGLPEDFMDLWNDESRCAA